MVTTRADGIATAGSGLDDNASSSAGKEVMTGIGISSGLTIRGVVSAVLKNDEDELDMMAVAKVIDLGIDNRLRVVISG